MGDNQQNITDLIPLWITGVRHTEEGEGDSVNNFRGNIFSSDQEEEFGPGGDFIEDRHGLFNRMRIIYQYESSRETFEHYCRIREHLENNMQTEQIMTISDLDSISKPGTSINSCSTWYLDTISSSSESEPLSTDPEVHLISSTDSNIGNLTKQKSIEDLDLTSSEIDDVPECSSPSSTQYFVLEPAESNSDTSSENPLRDNLLLQACILDLNDVPMNATISAIANQMIPVLFNQREVEILHHFLQYRIRITIDEINQRLSALARQQNAILSTLSSMRRPEEGSDSDGSHGSNTNISVSSWDFSSTTNEVEDSINNLLQNSPASPAAEINSEDTIFNNIEENSINREINHIIPQDNESMNEIDLSKTLSVSNMTSCSDGKSNSKESDQQSVESEILLLEESLESDGRTVRVLQIMSEMIPLSRKERRRLLRKHTCQLSEEERRALLQFIDSAQQTEQRPAGWWRSVRARLHLRQRSTFCCWWRRRRSASTPSPATASQSGGLRGDN